MELERRYYVASPTIKPGAEYLSTLQEAIDKATDMIATEGHRERCIVEVVAIVRKTPPPVTVEHITATRLEDLHK